MRYRKLAANNDYTFGHGQLDFYINEPAAVGQSVVTRLLLWLGEWYLDITEGTPYMQGVLGKYSQANADATVQARTLQTTGVTDINKFESVLDPDSRAYSVQKMAIDTVFGPTQVQLENYANY